MFIFITVAICGGIAEGDLEAKAVGVCLLITAVGIIACVIANGVISTNRERAKLQAIGIANVDNMDGVEFENYVKALLIHKGLTVETTKATGDLGVDLVAKGPGGLVAIQVKRQTSKVSRRAVSDAVAGKAHYRCTLTMVVTNNYFTPGAKELAKSNRCELVDGDILTQWIMDFQR